MAGVEGDEQFIKEGIEDNIMSAKEVKEIRHEKKMEENSGGTFENHVVERSSSGKQTTVERECGGNNLLDMIYIEEDLNNSDLNMQLDKGLEQNAGVTFENPLFSTGSNSQASVEDGLHSIKANNADIIDNGDVRTIEWVQIEGNVPFSGKDLNNAIVSEPLQHENGMEENCGMKKTHEKIFENHADDTSALNPLVEDGVTSLCEDIENNNVENIEDSLKNDGLTVRNGELIENNAGLNDDIQLNYESKMEQNPEITFETFVIEHSNTLNSQAMSKDDDASSIEWLNIESNLVYLGKDVSNDSLKTERNNEVEEISRMVTVNHVDDSLTSQKGVENPLSSKEGKDVENKLLEINIQDDLGNDGSRVQIENSLAVVNIKESEENDGLNGEENNMVDSTGNDYFVNSQVQHEKELEELRIALQNEYQKQVLKISDELQEHYQNDMDEKIAKLEEDWELEFTKQKREFDEQVAAVQREQSTQCQEAIERVTLDAEDQLKNMKSSYERETAEHKQRIKELLEREALWEMNEKELANEKSQKENESFSKIKELENKLSSERDEVESKLNNAQDEIKTLKKQHEREMECLTNELEKKYNDIVEEMRNELKSKYQDEMDRKVNQVECHLREQYEEDLEKTKEEVHESTSTLKTKYEKQVAEILGQLEELHERNQQHELREARLKENVESEKTKVAELLREVEGKTKMGEEFKQNQEDFKTLEEKFKQCLNEKCSLEGKVKALSESMVKVIALQEELTEKSEIIHKMEENRKDLQNMFDELQERLQKVIEEKNSLEKKLNKDLKDEKLTAGVLKNGLEVKEMNRLENKDGECSQEKLALEEILEQATETQMNENSQHELQRKQNETPELRDKINDGNVELESKLNELTVEKQSLQQQLVDSRSVINSLQEKLKENESLASELKSNYDAKILQITRNFEEEVSALENELKLKTNSEEDVLRFKKDVSSLKNENSKLNEELKEYKATISELEETSRSRELEIANLILNSPQSLSVEEFDFSGNSSDRTQELENELAKYKKKIRELEEEAEDKFETTLCPNCQDREKSEEILLQTKTLVDKIQLDCQKKVENVSRELEKTEKALQEQMKVGESLKTKLAKAEDEIKEERKRSLEISKLAKTFDMNEKSVKEMKDEEMKTSNSAELELRQEDEETPYENSASELPNNKDFESLFDEQEKFYKKEISRKDQENSQLMIENEKIQQQVQNLKEKLDEGAAKNEELRIRTLEQKTKYENEIKLMQNEIKMLIEENNEVKDQLEKKSENLPTKFHESELVVQAKELQAKLDKTENILKENSTKYEEEIVILKEFLNEKENHISELRNSLELLEKSKEGLEFDISNQKQKFSERERNLLDEIQKMTAAFGNEEILDDSFVGQEGKKDDSFKMLIHEYKEEVSSEIPRQYGGNSGIDMDNLPKEPIDVGEHEGVDRDSLHEEWSEDAKGKLVDMKSHAGINWDNLLEEHTNHGDIYGYETLVCDNVPTKDPRMQVTSKRNQYEEINYYPLDDFQYGEEAHSDIDEDVLKNGKETKRLFQKDEKYKQGSETPWEIRHEVYGPLQGSSRESLFSDGKYKEIGEEKLELLKYEHDIDLSLERNENERLRAEIETLTNCVGVFHDECESLKRSLDKTLELVERLRDERDGLVKKHDLNMAEHSELVLDLIKYEETIERLQRGNEKLEDDRKVLEECLMEKQVMLPHESRNERRARFSYSPKTKTNSSKQVDRAEGEWRLTRQHRLENQVLFSNNLTGEHSMQLGSEVGEFPREDSQWCSKGNNETNFLRSEALGMENGYQRTESLMFEDLVKEAKLERGTDEDNEEIIRRLPTLDDLHHRETFRDDFTAFLPDRIRNKKNEREGNRKITAAEMKFSKESKMLHKEKAFGNDFTEWLPSVDSIEDVQRQDERRKSISHENEDYYLRNKSKLSNVSSRQSYVESPSQRTKREVNHQPQASLRSFTRKSLRSNKQPEKRKVKSNSVHVEDKRRSNLLQGKASRKQTSKNGSMTFANDKVPYSFHDASEVLRTPSRRVPKWTSSHGITGHQKPVKSHSKKGSPTSKRVPRSRLPNGSALDSPNFSSTSILTSTRANVTTTNRLVPNLSGLSPIVSPLDRHYHAEKLKWQSSVEDYNNTSRANSTSLLLSVDPNTFYSSRFKNHNRFRSADDRLLTSSRDMSLSRDFYQDKPLVINFEDFVFRHRVKSSEDVANIRDPSPAELWFS